MPIGNNAGAEMSPIRGCGREPMTLSPWGHERRGRLVKSVIAILLTALVALQYQLWRGDRGMPGVWRLEAAVALQREDNARLEARNRRLAAEVHDLKEGLEAVEERARTDLGMIGRDETFYQLIER